MACMRLWLFDYMEKTITAIEAQKHNRNRANIYLDGVYAFSLDRLTAAWLKPGRKLTESEIAQLLSKDEQASAYNRALHFLSFRSRSTKEVRTYLHQKGYSDNIVEAVLAKLGEEGLLDDSRFSQEWVENRTTFRPRSQNLLSWELKQKGVLLETVENAISEAHLDDAELALKAARHAVGCYSALPSNDFNRKLNAYLQRRGFSALIARATTHQMWDEMQNSKQRQDTE